MAKTNYPINFVNGSSTGTLDLPVGIYTFVSTTISGYTDGTVQQFEITPTTTSIALAMAANGMLTVNVKDDLQNPITSGSVKFSDQTGTTSYGAEKTITNGVATFSNVPYSAGGISTYIAQTASDANHNPIATPSAVSMTQLSQSKDIENERKKATLSFTVADQNYAGITPLTGEIQVNG